MSDQKKLILIGLAISCLIVLAAVVQGKSDGPVGPPPTAPTSAEAQPQNALTELAIETGYDIGGEPKYDAKLGRWAMLAAVPGCKVKVVLGGNRGPEKQSPEGLSVLSIGEQQLQNPVPLAAEDLKRNPEWRRLLDCV